MSEEEAADVRINLRRVDVPPGTLPPCDERCRRWEGMPHMHVKTEGLDDATPFLTVIVYCSCGFIIEEADYNADVRDDPRLAPAATPTQMDALLDHYRSAHDLDITTNEAWLKAWATPPGAA